MNNIMFQGTASNVGKSVISMGICRILKQDGYSVIPFKSQNMSQYSKIDAEGLEMGIGQYLQAQACEIEPKAIMNPILLKPCGNHMSELLLNGVSLGRMNSREYGILKPSLIPKLKNIYDELAGKSDIIVLEGAGSPVEININAVDISNMEMAKIADSPVILIADIDRGGVFATILGTIELLNEDDRKRVKGIIINKFRGKKEYFKEGVEIIERLVNIPVLGVVPYIDINFEEEDGASGKATSGETMSDESLILEFDRLATHLRENIDIERLYDIIFEHTI